MTTVLDSGALIAIDRRDHRVETILRVLQREHEPIVTSAGAVAQVWRGGGRQANLARLLPGVVVMALDGGASRLVGELLGASRTSDVIDAHVAMLAQPGGAVLTSDPDDIRTLLRSRRVKAHVVTV